MGLLNGLLMFLLLVTAVFMIVLVLIQRGKGGGLAGAFGGMGGQSAFGTKAGDLFTKITIVVAVVWVLLCVVAVKTFSRGNAEGGPLGAMGNAPPPKSAAPAVPGKQAAPGKAESSAPAAKTPAQTPAKEEKK
jgi:preprotein translocase subunit SecG